MKRRNELVREAVAILIAHGHAPAVSNGGKHIKLTWTSAGRRHVLVVSQSPSDRRARLRSRTILRRLMNTGAVTTENSRRTDPC